ncbi:MAG: phosphatidate cytidylyltransferase [candidate division Zixibacteria bacterium]
MIDFTLPIFMLISLLGILTIPVIIRLISKRRFLFDSYLGYSWLFFLGFIVFEIISRPVGIGILAFISFRAIREYFSLADIRLQDRLAILGAYLSIPFLYYFVYTEWYGMFIVSVPVYAFLAIPILVTLGGKKTEGTVLSIGIINYGLFLFVFCIGHIGYLLLYSSWLAALLIINVFVCDLVICLVRHKTSALPKKLFYSFFLSAPLTIAISLLLSGWTEIPFGHSAILASMIPILVIMGHHVGDYIEKDLGIEEDLLVPGRGQILDNLQSLFYVAPVMFHYIRYFLK